MHEAGMRIAYCVLRIAYCVLRDGEGYKVKRWNVTNVAGSGMSLCMRKRR